MAMLKMKSIRELNEKDLKDRFKESINQLMIIDREKVKEKLSEFAAKPDFAGVKLPSETELSFSAQEINTTNSKKNK